MDDFHCFPDIRASSGKSGIRVPATLNTPRLSEMDFLQVRTVEFLRGCTRMLSDVEGIDVVVVKGAGRRQYPADCAQLGRRGDRRQRRLPKSLFP